MFGRIARRYDRANTVLSFGTHHAWRRKAVKAARVGPGDHSVDVACGTGDLSFALKRTVGPTGSVVGVDFTPEMLDMARAKAAAKGQDVGFQAGDALALPLADHAFDAATIAFGIRNVDDPPKCIQEMHRVVRPGGRVVVLEFGQPTGPFGACYRAYSKHVMPRIGGMITGDRSAYEYLPRTAADFPAGEAFTDMMEQAADFDDLDATPLTGGVAWIYSGTTS